MDPKDVIGEVAEELQCVVCYQVLENPHSCHEGHTFCKGCVLEWIQRSPTCPIGREALHADGLSFNRPLASIIDRLVVRCTNHDADGRASKKRRSDEGVEVSGGGCEWTGKKSDLQTHLDSVCQFQRHECPNSRCRTLVFPCEMEEHKKGCIFRNVQCKLCSKCLLAVDLGVHETMCPSAIVPCPRECGRELVRSSLPTHEQEECPLTPVQCPFEAHGCRVRPVRRDIIKHQTEGADRHASIVSEKMAEMERMHREMDMRVAQLEARLDRTVQRVNDTVSGQDRLKVHVDSTSERLSESIESVSAKAEALEYCEKRVQFTIYDAAQRLKNGAVVCSYPIEFGPILGYRNFKLRFRVCFLKTHLAVHIEPCGGEWKGYPLHLAGSSITIGDTTNLFDDSVAIDGPQSSFVFGFEKFMTKKSLKDTDCFYFYDRVEIDAVIHVEPDQPLLRLEVDDSAT